jgi:hypothetical protein
MNQNQIAKAEHRRQGKTERDRHDHGVADMLVDIEQKVPETHALGAGERCRTSHVMRQCVDDELASEPIAHHENVRPFDECVGRHA